MTWVASSSGSGLIFTQLTVASELKMMNFGLAVAGLMVTPWAMIEVGMADLGPNYLISNSGVELMKSLIKKRLNRCCVLRLGMPAWEKNRWCQSLEWYGWLRLGKASWYRWSKRGKEKEETAVYLWLLSMMDECWWWWCWSKGDSDCWEDVDGAIADWFRRRRKICDFFVINLKNDGKEKRGI